MLERSNLALLKNRRVHATQLGAREYYNYPRIFNANNNLASFSTDIWTPWAQHFPFNKIIPCFNSRFHQDLKNYPVSSLPIFAQAFSKNKQINNRYQNWLRQGRGFANWACKNIERSGLSSDQATFGYTCANLEVMQLAKSYGTLAIHGQIDPGLLWYKTMQEELETWHDIEIAGYIPTSGFEQRLRDEWQVADIIIANSSHTKTSLMIEGVDQNKVIIIPLAYDGYDKKPVLKKPLKNRKLRVLFVGNVSLSKGFPYFAQAAADMKSEGEFVAAGNVLIDKGFLAKKNWPVQYLNHINKRELELEYKKADVLVFPTLSDGFGMVQLEAMSYGLPVLATQECAQVIEHGISGYTIKTRSSDSIVEHLLMIKNDQNLYNRLSLNARQRVKDFSLKRLSSIFE